MKNHDRCAWLACALALLALAAATADAKPVVRNLGGGLEQIATSAGRAKALAADPKGQKVVESRVAGFEVVRPVVFDKSGRPLVRISLDGKAPAAAALRELRAMAGVEVKASDLKYRAGVIEAYVPAASLPAIATKKGVRPVVPSSRMRTDIGTARSQGIVQLPATRRTCSEVPSCCPQA